MAWVVPAPQSSMSPAGTLSQVPPWANPVAPQGISHRCLWPHDWIDSCFRGLPGKETPYTEAVLHKGFYSVHTRKGLCATNIVSVGAAVVRLQIHFINKSWPNEIPWDITSQLDGVEKTWKPDISRPRRPQDLDLTKGTVCCPGKHLKERKERPLNGVRTRFACHRFLWKSGGLPRQRLKFVIF